MTVIFWSGDRDVLYSSQNNNFSLVSRRFLDAEMHENTTSLIKWPNGPLLA